MNSDNVEMLIDEILAKARTIAVVGISSKPERPSNGVARVLMNSGFNVIGVNPAMTEVLGSACYPTLNEVPEKIDLVDVFRKPDEVGPIVDAVIELGIPYLWFQEGVINEFEAERARSEGVKVVMDRCIAKELPKRIG